MIMSQTFLKKTLKKKMIVTQHFQNIVLKKCREIMIRRSQKLVLQEHDNQEIESSEHKSSSGSVGQPHRQPDISYKELRRLICH